MADEPEDSQLLEKTTGSALETRIAALETRSKELETRLNNRVDNIEKKPINSVHERLSRLETRHENLLRHTPEAREEPYSVWNVIIGIIVAIIIMILPSDSALNSDGGRIITDPGAPLP